MIAKQLTLSLMLAAAGALSLQAQEEICVTWTSLPPAEADQVETKHMFYRDKIKAGDLTAAMPLWQEVYAKAPAADGQRPFHYIDGRTLYLDLYANAETDEQKQEYADMIVKLYDEQRACYPDDAIGTYSSQVYDMFYTMNRPYDDIYPVAVTAMEEAGEKTDFRVLTPVGYLVPYMFTRDLIDAAEARRVVEMARGIAAANADGPQGQNYTDAIEAADKSVAVIERNIFDCDYFKAKLEPEYRANPDDYETQREVVRTLRQAGCSLEDPLVAELVEKTNAYELAEYERNNPVTAARKMIDEGDIEGGMAKLESVADTTSNADKKAALYLNMASLYREENQYSTARKYANMAAAAKPGWGRPYIMIGDMYASSSSSCSTDPFNQRLVILAALNKYRQAAADPETKSTANSRISKYSSSLPTTEMLFERGLKPGETKSTGCWIGETVTLRAS